MNHQPRHTQTGNHQPDNTPETPPHNYPASAIAAWRQLTGQPPNQPLDPDWHHNFTNCYHGSWPNRSAYIETLVEDLFSQQLETITNTIGIPTNYIRWNYQAIWEDTTRCFDIIENEDGVHVFEQ